MMHCKRHLNLFVGLCVLGWVGTVMAASQDVFRDDFDTAYDYLSQEEVGSTGWDGFIGLGDGETAEAINANMDYEGMLYLSSSNSYWEPDFEDYGPFLYKLVEGDFTATTYIGDFTGIDDDIIYNNDCFLMARDPESDADVENFECMHYFPTWVGNLGRDMEDSSETEWGSTGDTYDCGRYIQLERSGDDFYFRYSDDGETWTEMDGSPVTRDDLPETLQVGVAQCTYNTDTDTVGYAAFEYVEIIGAVDKTKAYNPSPGDDDDDVIPTVTLSWSMGQSGDTDNLYFGTDRSAVAAATLDDPQGVLVGQGLTDLTYTPAKALDYGQTCYWRVDDVNADTGDITTGKVWNFTVEPVTFVLDSNSITVNASSLSSGSLQATVDGNGLDDDELHSTDPTAMWLSDSDDTQPWIEYSFDQAYLLSEMWIWNSNQSIESILGFGIKEAMIEVSLDGTEWTVWDANLVLAQAGDDAPTAVTSKIDLAGVYAQYVRVTALSNWSSIGMTECGLSEVRFYNTPVKARLPEPADGDTDVDPSTPLSWRAGRYAVEHDVYLSSDVNAVTEGMAPMVAVTSSELDLSDQDVVYGQSYYWRVDEVNEAMDITRFEGDVWSFSTPDYLVLDDFEDYDDECHRIYWYWRDGAGYSENEDCGMSAYSGNGSSSSCYVGYLKAEDGTFGEVSIVADGDQSLPFEYDNSSSPKYSEAQALEGLLPTDWTVGGAAWLSLYFHGLSINDGGSLYVKINDTKVTCDTSLELGIWTRWLIDLSTVDEDLSHVESFAIGVSDSGATGLVYIDEIGLYHETDGAVTSSDPGTEDLVAYWPLNDGSGDVVADAVGNLDGAVEGSPDWVDGYVDGALELDGSFDYVDCGTDSAFDLTEEITLSAWVYPYDAGNSEHNPFVGKGDTAYAIKHGSGNSLQFFIYDGSWYTASTAVTESFSDNWHFVAGTYDGSEAKLYVDGVLRSTKEYEGSIGTNDYALYMGCNSEDTDRKYEGIVDEVRLYDRALTEGELRYLAGDE